MAFRPTINALRRLEDSKLQQALAPEAKIAIERTEVDTLGKMLDEGLSPDTKFTRQLIGRTEEIPLLCLAIEMTKYVKYEEGATSEKSKAIACLEHLLKKGATQKKIIDITGGSALHYAAQHEVSLYCVDLLIQYGGDINARDALRNTPLHYLVQSLIERKSDPQKAKTILETWLHHGADVKPINRKRYSALDIALGVRERQKEKSLAVSDDLRDTLGFGLKQAGASLTKAARVLIGKNRNRFPHLSAQIDMERLAKVLAQNEKRKINRRNRL